MRRVDRWEVFRRVTSAAVAICGFGVGCLLIASGIWKSRDPSATREALATARLPARPIVARVLALTEVVLGTTLVVFGSWESYAAAALIFGGFSGFVLNALLRHIPIRTCGCFGKADSPASWIHLAVTASVSVAMAFGSALTFTTGSVIGAFNGSSSVTVEFGSALAIVLYALLGPLANLWNQIRTAVEPARAA